LQANGSYLKIYQVIARIPYGKVATYGQIARLAGFGGQARLAGYALHNLPGDSNVPWHRVINHRGKISYRATFDKHDNLQKKLLELEGIIFNEYGNINLKLYGWNE
jgi:methylated-DNA-protein-cysteine methyltransferase-like protein